MACRPAKLPR